MNARFTLPLPLVEYFRKDFAQLLRTNPFAKTNAYWQAIEQANKYGSIGVKPVLVDAVRLPLVDLARLIPNNTRTTLLHSVDIWRCCSESSSQAALIVGLAVHGHTAILNDLAALAARANLIEERLVIYVSEQSGIVFADLTHIHQSPPLLQLSDAALPSLEEMARRAKQLQPRPPSPNPRGRKQRSSLA